MSIFMQKSDRYYCSSRRKYCLKVHIVLVTKYRKPLLPGNFSSGVKAIFSDIAEKRLEDSSNGDRCRSYSCVTGIRYYRTHLWYRKGTQTEINILFMGTVCQCTEKRILEKENILVWWVFRMQHWRSIRRHDAALHQKSGLTYRCFLPRSKDTWVSTPLFLWTSADLLFQM